MNRHTSTRFLSRTSKVLPRMVMRWIQRVRGRAPDDIPFGAVRFGDFRRFSPIGSEFGWGRGTPVDRYYIEKFLTENADHIRGNVLELGDDRYTRRFGGDRVDQIHILSVEADNPNATIIGDLTQANTLPEAKFDCIVLTQVIQLVFDLSAAVDSLYRSLKPGGVLLVTAPGITPMGIRIERWSHVPWYWAVTTHTLRRLMEKRFGQDAVSIEAHGNIFAATAFLYGLAIEELDASDLNADDAIYPVIVAARVVKRK